MGEKCLGGKYPVLPRIFALVNFDKNAKNLLQKLKLCDILDLESENNLFDFKNHSRHLRLTYFLT